MNNLKRAAYNISSKLGWLNSHQSLVIAISEERQVQDTILKLVLARVNASTSLLRWAKKEENQAMRDCICRLYDISLMYASVQRKFAEQNNALHMALKDILQCEVTLEALKKNLKDVTEKKDRLQKSTNDGIRKRIDMVRASNVPPYEEIQKLHEEEEQLKKELEDKTRKAEIFKSTAIKQSMNSVCDAHLKLAEGISSIFVASKKVINEINELPHLYKDKVKEPGKSSVVSDLAKDLNISRPIASNMTTPLPIFHVDLGRNRKLSDFKGRDRGELKKSISKPVLQNSTKLDSNGRNTIDTQFNSDFVIISNSKPPSVPPPVPPIDPVARKRAQTVETSSESSLRKHNNNVIYQEFDPAQPAVMDHEYFDIGGDNSSGCLYRSASDSNISKSSGDYAYVDPWENFRDDCYSNNDMMAELETKLVGEIDVEKKVKSFQDLDKLYGDPAALNSAEKYTTLQPEEEILYSQPNVECNINPRREGSLYLKDIYENTATLSASDSFNSDAEYVDNDLVQETIKSKLEMLDNIVKKNVPIPKPKPRPEVSKGKGLIHSPTTRKTSSPVLPSHMKNSTVKKIPPKPKPRMAASLYGAPPTLDDAFTKGPGTVKGMAMQMGGKIHPAALIPSMTQAKLIEEEEMSNQNNS